MEQFTPSGALETAVDHRDNGLRVRLSKALSMRLPRINSAVRTAYTGGESNWAAPRDLRPGTMARTDES